MPLIITGGTAFRCSTPRAMLSTISNQTAPSKRFTPAAYQFHLPAFTTIGSKHQQFLGLTARTPRIIFRWWPLNNNNKDTTVPIPRFTDHFLDSTRASMNSGELGDYKRHKHRRWTEHRKRPHNMTASPRQFENKLSVDLRRRLHRLIRQQTIYTTETRQQDPLTAKLMEIWHFDSFCDGFLIVLDTPVKGTELRGFSFVLTAVFVQSSFPNSQIHPRNFGT